MFSTNFAYTFKDRAYVVKDVAYMLETSLSCFSLHCPLIWKEKKSKVKLTMYELLEKHNNLRLHSCFFVRKFRGGASPQTSLDHNFSQLVFYDQAK